MTERLYDDNLYQFGTPQKSYWEATADECDFATDSLQTTETCDVLVIGGGYTGLSAALHLARDYNVDVRVLEAGHIGWGASGRNGGFCSMGGTGVHPQQLAKMAGIDATRDFYRSQIDAIELVRELSVSEDIDLQEFGNAELDVAHTPKAFDRLVGDHELYSGKLGIDTQLFSADECRERYFDSVEQYGGIRIRPTFGLHPLRYCRGLARAAIGHGAKIHAFSEVTRWERSSEGSHRVSTNSGTVVAKRVIYATNGFMPESLRPEFFARSLPVISAIIVTSPLSDDEKKAHAWVTEHPAINSRRIMNYFRMLPDNRLLFGGRGHSTGHVAGENETYKRLESMLKTIWPRWKDVAVDYGWHGLICTTSKLYPSIGRLAEDDSVFYGFGYHGNGVNTATWTGKQLAQWIAGKSEPAIPEIMRGLGGKYPLAGFRLKYLQAAIGLSSWLDRRG